MPSQMWIGAYLTKPIITILKIGKKFFISIYDLKNFMEKNTDFLNRNYKNGIFIAYKKQL